MKIKAYLSTFLIVSIFVVANSCSKETLIEPVEQTNAIDFREYHVAYYRDSKDGASLEIRFIETPQIISLSKSAKNYEKIKALLDESRDHKTTVAIHLNGKDAKGMYTMNEAKSGTPIGFSIFTNIWPPFKDSAQTNPGFLRAIVSMGELKGIFDYMEAQGCATGTAEIDHCIPFQYVVDGCYARAHKMRQVLIEKYNLYCEKVFSFEGPSGYLAVDAGDCCVYWWYHVAPLMTVSTLGGTTKYVMDPSMFNHPVTIEEWTMAQENTDCSPDADFGTYDIEPGSAFWPYGTMGPYGEDNDFYWTNMYLDLYSGLVTCD